jgi:predicted DNA-binding protein (UPF0251 family)
MSERGIRLRPSVWVASKDVLANVAGAPRKDAEFSGAELFRHTLLKHKAVQHRWVQRSAPMSCKKAPLVERVLTMLSPEERLALVLRHTRNLGVTQIALRLGCPRAAAVRVLQQAEAKVHAAQHALIEALIEHATPSRPTRRSAPVAQKRTKVGAGYRSVAVQVAGA